MTDDQREIRRELRVLEYAELSGDVSKPCRYFGAAEPVSTAGVMPIEPTVNPGWLIRGRCLNGLSRLPRGTRVRKVHMKHYNKQAPGRPIQIAVKFLILVKKAARRPIGSSTPPSTMRHTSALSRPTDDTPRHTLSTLSTM